MINDRFTTTRRHHDRHDPRRRPSGAPFGGPGGYGGGFREGFGGRGRGGLVRRGEVRPLILGTLGRRPMHGYEIIQELEAQSGGRWRPSAGSIYPTLQQLADEGLVTSEEVDGRRVYTLTEAGRAAAGDMPRTPWSDPGRDQSADIRHLGRQVVEATMQVQRVGSPEAIAAARQLLVGTRARLYSLLADDTGMTGDVPTGDGDDDADETGPSSAE